MQFAVNAIALYKVKTYYNLEEITSHIKQPTLFDFNFKKLKSPKRKTDDSLKKHNFKQFGKNLKIKKLVD